MQSLRLSRTVRLLIAATAINAAIAVPSHAQSTGVVSFTNGSIFSAFDTDETVGWQFRTGASALTVTALGWWDETPTTPLAATHQVGIWTATGSLLGSTTVLTTSTLLNGFRYVNVTPILLAANSTFLVGGRDLVGDGDNYVTSVGSLVTGAGVTFTGAARSDNGTGFTAPTIITANTGGRFGANFQYVTTTTVIPEPSTYALVATGLVALGGVARRRRTPRA
ncbi:MAG: PEP-CTERM sorting domain-containing protein [Gemmatimonadaceae bacterium]|nr:PEP-CTERM sorting domain-containing protein [Gemmatimonadaceae bacterium]